jgi:hypothetical protein
MPSMCKLVGHFRKAYGTSAPDARMLLEHNAASLDAQLAIRRAHPELPLLDVRFEDVVDDLAGVVERIYAHADLPLRDEARAAMLRWDEEHVMHERGAFGYTLDEVGLDEVHIRSRMHAYFELLATLDTATAMAPSATKELTSDR